MAKRKQTTEAATGQENGQPEGENVSGYFRKVFGENPKWLGRPEQRRGTGPLAQGPSGRDGGSQAGQAEPLQREKQPPPRRAARNPADRRRRAGPPSRPPPLAAAPRKGVHGLESLEEQIDECMTLAKNLDREGPVQRHQPAAASKKRSRLDNGDKTSL